MYGSAHAASLSDEAMANFERYNCSLIVVPEQVDSFVCANVLNYFGFPITVEEDNLVR